MKPEEEDNEGGDDINDGGSDDGGTDDGGNDGGSDDGGNNDDSNNDGGNNDGGNNDGGNNDGGSDDNPTPPTPTPDPQEPSTPPAPVPNDPAPVTEETEPVDKQEYLDAYSDQPAAPATDTTPVLQTQMETVGEKPGTVEVTGLSCDAELKVSEETLETTPGVKDVKIDGTNVTVTADKGFSGIIKLPVTVTENGKTMTLEIDVTVKWEASPNASSYKVMVNGKIICETSEPGCNVKTLVGPKTDVQVMALGNDNTMSVTKMEYVENKFHIENVYFDTDSATLDKADRAILKKIASLIVSEGFTTVYFEGHTDNRGGKAYNKALSDRRAEAAKQYILSLLPVDVKAPTIGYGYAKPSDANTSDKGMAINRRTEIHLK